LLATLRAEQERLAGPQPLPARGESWQRARSSRSFPVKPLLESELRGLLPVSENAPSPGGRRARAGSRRHLHARGPILPQAVAQDLSAIALGKIGNDEDLLRHFRRRQKGLAMSAH